MFSWITGGLSLFFLLLLFYIMFRIWLEARQDRLSPRRIEGEALPDDLREAALRPLRRLREYYEKRDPALADACIDETMPSDALLILGTNPREIFYGRDGARALLEGDWKYWGRAEFDADGTALSRVGGALYFIMRGQIRLNFCYFRIPLKMTGVLEEKDGRWYIAKIQFANEVNSNYAIVAWVPALALAASLALFGLSHLL